MPKRKKFWLLAQFPLLSMPALIMSAGCVENTENQTKPEQGSSTTPGQGGTQTTPTPNPSPQPGQGGSQTNPGTGESQGQPSSPSGLTQDTEYQFEAKNENELKASEAKFAAWAERLDNFLIIDENLTQNVIELLQDKKLYYSFKTQSVVASSELPGKPAVWERATVVFKLKEQHSKDDKFNLSSPNNSAGDKKENIQLEYQIIENKLIISYRASLYKGKKVNPVFSKNVYKSVFNIAKNTQNSTDNNNSNAGSATAPSQPENGAVSTTQPVTPSQNDGSVYSNLVAKSLKNASGVTYQQDNYYASLEGLSGDALRAALFELVKKHRNHGKSYNALYATYRDAFVDKYYENDGSVMDMYAENPSGNDPYKYNEGNKGNGGREGGGWNREHIIAQSWFNKQSPMRDDAHHVWPTDAEVNARHSNYPYGEVKNATFTSRNGTKVGSGVEDNQPVTEVINEFKGDVARAILYFALVYRDKNLTQNGSGKRFFTTGNQIKPKFLQTMLTWSAKDPLTQFDLDRNNGIYKHQRNRNVFSDYPELIDVVYGNNNTYVFKNKGIATQLVFEQQA
ncbi:endonuclease [Mycoplasma simbae]|uniref:endonuclease n=1 Tax=Mycoplasma simbae TaxID=36744 RepID=UPI00068932DE|nr:endonuclease [Mycoplasma simbae]